ncbi:MAG: PfkB family carbohydrate kinase [Verrucomicrobiota bacterium]
MSTPARVLSAVQSASRKAAAKHALIGFDGFVDTIVNVVDRRSGSGENFTAVPTITAFARRIDAAAGRSTNIELYPRMEKPGGNGPLMASALAAAGVRVTLVGSLGAPDIHPAFSELATRCHVISLCPPGLTTALEFRDGKVMLGVHASLGAVTLPAIEAAMGADSFLRHLSGCDLIAPLNWTMLPSMTEILRGLCDDVLPSLPATKTRHFFFDLCDPEKRSSSELIDVLKIISRFTTHGRVTLGLNFKEASRIASDLAFAGRADSPDGMQALAADIRGDLGLGTVIVHTRRAAAAADEKGTAYVDGTYTETPLISTGAGDHFNAGYARGLLLDLDSEACLALGCATSGHYVRTASSPTAEDLENFLTRWKDGTLD